MGNLETTVQMLMQQLAEQARKLDEQAKTIAHWERHQMLEEGAAPPQQFQFSPGAAEEEDWGDDHGGHWKGGGQDGGDEGWSEWKETKVPPPALGIPRPVEDPASSEAQHAAPMYEDSHYYPTDGCDWLRGGGQETWHEPSGHWGGYGAGYGGGYWRQDPFVKADPWNAGGAGATSAPKSEDLHHCTEIGRSRDQYGSRQAGWTEAPASWVQPASWTQMGWVDQGWHH